jgi:hypothetical protein
MVSFLFQPLQPLQQQCGGEKMITRPFLQVFAEQVQHAGFLFFDGAFRNT